MSDLIDRQTAIKAIKNIIGTGASFKAWAILDAIMKMPSAQPEQAVKDCRNCKHGKYNDYHDTYFCYNAEDCSNWDKWETSAQQEIIFCKGCKHRSTDECPMYYEEWIEYDEGDGFIERDFLPHDRTFSDGFCFKGERREDE